MKMLMTDENIPAIEIIKAMIEQIDHAIKIEQVKYDFEKMEYKFLLSKGGKTCEISLPRDFLDDLNDYKGSRESTYWIALECTLKKRLSIPLQITGLIPFSSSIFFEDFQEWERDNGHDIEVYYSADDYEIFQDGLKDLYQYLEHQKTELSRLRLKTFPYTEDQQRIQNMIYCREEEIEKSGLCPLRDRISVASRIHFKAAALMRLLFYENELGQGRYSLAVKKEITAKIIKILTLLLSPIFEKIEIAEYLHGIHKERHPEQPEIVMSNNPQKPQYDVVISFAGEDRGYAEKLAELLKNDGFKVFYDKYEEADLWGKNLYEHLIEIYCKRGKYCVMFLSKHYAEKQWPTLERRAAQERAFREHEAYILPIRIDNTEIPGMLSTVAYQDLREKSIEDIYDILKRKLSPGKEHVRAQSEPDSIGQLGLSDDAIILLKLLSDKSERALSNDPMLTAEEVLNSLKLSEEELSLAADELDEKGFVKLHKALSMGKSGFYRIGTKELLFSVTDKYLRDWNPEEDTVTLAKALIDIAQEGHAVSIRDADEYLKWGPRRINPVLYLLIDMDMVNPSKALNSDYIAINVILKPKLYRFIRQTEKYRE